jgi:hypothetical protein
MSASLPALNLPTLHPASFLKNFVFTYFPVTDWRRFISPTIVFGNANISDLEVEQKVVDSVGSYGYQLNRILDALAVLIREEETPGKTQRTEMDRRVLYRLLDLADAADKAAKKAQATKQT